MIFKSETRKSGDDTGRTSLRILPGLIIVLLQCLVRFVLPLVEPRAMMIAIFAGLFGGLAVAVWWLFFSKAPRIERWGAIVLIITALFATSLFLDESIARANMGLMFIIYSIPVMSIAFVCWAAITRNLSVVYRRITMVVTVLLASGVWILLRTNGITGEGRHDLGWRWAKTSEDRLIAQSGEVLPAGNVKASELNEGNDWPGFRGEGRDGIVHGIRIRTDWKASPPSEVWRKPVGPGCSSFAVRNNLIYTQEQRGEYEIVSCYDLNTGDPVWQHRDKARFYEPHAGAGPRSTPVLHEECVYALGATGIINALNASNGSVIWSRDAASDAGVKTPGWGFSGSPLVEGTNLLTPVAGKLLSYDTSDGKILWAGTDGGAGYSSPQLFTINGVKQVVLMSDSGAISVNPDNGKRLWEYKWKNETRILQPHLIEPNDLFLCGEYKSIQRVSVIQSGEGYTLKEIWTSSAAKAVFNDFIFCKGYAYGWMVLILFA